MYRQNFDRALRVFSFTISISNSFVTPTRLRPLAAPPPCRQQLYFPRTRGHSCGSGPGRRSLRWGQEKKRGRGRHRPTGGRRRRTRCVTLWGRGRRISGRLGAWKNLRQPIQRNRIEPLALDPSSDWLVFFLPNVIKFRVELRPFSISLSRIHDWQIENRNEWLYLKNRRREIWASFLFREIRCRVAYIDEVIEVAISIFPINFNVFLLFFGCAAPPTHVPHIIPLSAALRTGIRSRALAPVKILHSFLWNHFRSARCSFFSQKRKIRFVSQSGDETAILWPPPPPLLARIRLHSHLPDHHFIRPGSNSS